MLQIRAPPTRTPNSQRVNTDQHSAGHRPKSKLLGYLNLNLNLNIGYVQL